MIFQRHEIFWAYVVEFSILLLSSSTRRTMKNFKYTIFIKQSDAVKIALSTISSDYNYVIVTFQGTRLLGWYRKA